MTATERRQAGSTAAVGPGPVARPIAVAGGGPSVRDDRPNLVGRAPGKSRGHGLADPVGNVGRPVRPSGQSISGFSAIHARRRARSGARRSSSSKGEALGGPENRLRASGSSTRRLRSRPRFADGPMLFRPERDSKGLGDDARLPGASVGASPRPGEDRPQPSHPRTSSGGVAARPRSSGGPDPGAVWAWRTRMTVTSDGLGSAGSRVVARGRAREPPPTRRSPCGLARRTAAPIRPIASAAPVPLPRAAGRGARSGRAREMLEERPRDPGSTERMRSDQPRARWSAGGATATKRGAATRDEAHRGRQGMPASTGPDDDPDEEWRSRAPPMAAQDADRVAVGRAC